jgi:hypothetical protein
MRAVVTRVRAFVVPLLAALTIAAPSVAADQNLVGAWRLVSETVERGGQTTEPLGADPAGRMMLDDRGHFMLLIARRDLPKIAANRRDQGTPEENHHILAGMLAFFGAYTVSPDQVLMIHVEAGSFPNWIGSDQKREFALAGDEMTWVNRAPAVSGETAKLVWKRE